MHIVYDDGDEADEELSGGQIRLIGGVETAASTEGAAAKTEDAAASTEPVATTTEVAAAR